MGHAKPRYVIQTERWSDLNIQFRRRSSSCSIRSKQWVMRRRTSLVKWRLCVTTRRSVVTNQNYFRFERQLQPCQSRPSFESALVRVSPRQSRSSSESALVRVGPRPSRPSLRLFIPQSMRIILQNSASLQDELEGRVKQLSLQLETEVLSAISRPLTYS